MKNKAHPFKLIVGAGFYLSQPTENDVASFVKHLKEKEIYDHTLSIPFPYTEKDGKVEVHEKPWEVKDDEGALSNSLMPPPVAVSLIKQLVKALGI